MSKCLLPLYNTTLNEYKLTPVIEYHIE
jgi:hypothetical protein